MLVRHLSSPLPCAETSSLGCVPPHLPHRWLNKSSRLRPHQVIQSAADATSTPYLVRPLIAGLLHQTATASKPSTAGDSSGPHNSPGLSSLKIDLLVARATRQHGSPHALDLQPSRSGVLAVDCSRPITHLLREPSCILPFPSSFPLASGLWPLPVSYHHRVICDSTTTVRIQHQGPHSAGRSTNDAYHCSKGQHGRPRQTTASPASSFSLCSSPFRGDALLHLGRVLSQLTCFHTSPPPRPPERFASFQIQPHQLFTFTQDQHIRNGPKVCCLPKIKSSTVTNPYQKCLVPITMRHILLSLFSPVW